MLAQAVEAPLETPPPRTESKFRRIISHPATHVAVLLLLTFFCFGRALKGYFLADDFGQILYVHKAFTDEPERILRNWTGHLMEIPSMAIYRPWFFMSLYFDYALFRGNALGYLFTNLAYYVADVVLLYVLIRKLTQDWPRWRSQAASFFSAALFAVNPLHCESVAWISGRTDAMCATYYLASLVFAFSKRTPLTIALSVICFALAMLSKEMAIGTFVLIAAAGLFWRPRWSWKNCLPIFGATILYFIVRYLALGTITGGYTGGLGAGQAAQALQRWLDPDIIYRLFFPLTQYIYPGRTIYRTLLMVAYGATGAFIGFRLITGDFSKRWLAFLALWAATAAVPLYQLWGLGHLLQGGRYYFFLTIPISVFFAVSIFQPVPDCGGRRHASPLFQKATILATVALLVMIASLSRVCYATTSLWMHAGREVRHFHEACTKLAAEIQPNKYAVVLAAPNDHGGAHMLLNAPTFFMMMQPPFSKTVLSEKFLSFEPPIYGQFDTINSERFKQVVASPSTQTIVRWSALEEKLLPVSWSAGVLPGSSSSRLPLQITPSFSPNGLLLDNINCNPLDYDYLQVDVRYVDAPAPPTVTVSWNTDSDGASASRVLENKSEPDFRTIRVRLSHRLQWFTAGQINNLSIGLFPAKQLEFRNAMLVPSRFVAPTITVNGSMSQFGVISTTANTPIVLSPAPLRTAAFSQIQVSKPDFTFDDNDTAAVANNITVPAKTESLLASNLKIVSSGLYQLRSRWVNPLDYSSSEWSEPVTIQYSR